MHNTFVHTVHTNVCVMEACIDIYKQCAHHMLHINKYTIHAQEHRVHIQWARQAQRYTPFTFMHTQTHMRTHTSYTQASALTQPQAHTTSPHTGLSFPSSFPLIHPRFPSSCSVGTSNTWAVKRPGPPPQLDRTFQVVSTYCFLCLFSSLLLLFGLEELNEKWPIN